MQVIKDRLFAQHCDAIVVPITGSIDRSGLPVARLIEPISLKAQEKWKSLPIVAADRIARIGLCVQLAGKEKSRNMPYKIVLFPTRPSRVYPDDVGWEAVIPKYRNEPILGAVPGHMCKADLNIIRHSLDELVELTDDQKWGKVCLPPLGQGEGAAPWEDVLALMYEKLDDRFVLVDD